MSHPDDGHSKGHGEAGHFAEQPTLIAQAAKRLVELLSLTAIDGVISRKPPAKRDLANCRGLNRVVDGSSRKYPSAIAPRLTRVGSCAPKSAKFAVAIMMLGTRFESGAY